MMPEHWLLQGGEGAELTARSGTRRLALVDRWLLKEMAAAKFLPITEEIVAAQLKEKPLP